MADHAPVNGYFYYRFRQSFSEHNQRGGEKTEWKIPSTKWLDSGCLSYIRLIFRDFISLQRCSPSASRAVPHQVHELLSAVTTPLVHNVWTLARYGYRTENATTVCLLAPAAAFTFRDAPCFMSQPTNRTDVAAITTNPGELKQMSLEPPVGVLARPVAWVGTQATHPLPQLWTGQHRRRAGPETVSRDHRQVEVLTTSTTGQVRSGQDTTAVTR